MKALLYLAVFLSLFACSERKPIDPCQDKSMAYVMGQHFIEKRLKAPSTADFPWMSSDGVYVSVMGNCEFHVRGFVDAQNGFGAMIRTNYSLTLRYSKQSKKWHLESISI
ncbi:hypothetical protein A10D4_12809 [Idiomarina xiamenensis 10-D-4]|uniref:Lipoprotein n=1 Tax=Idiomarina xiamenensis 10-D-4 TaxID=740709 RepID=K2JV83_9GAMM|nr:hypothetical protein A10D4_12809 [Idiomarina xiamenensis 10-D-4]